MYLKYGKKRNLDDSGCSITVQHPRASAINANKMNLQLIAFALRTP